MENPIKMDDLGGKTHYFRKHPYSSVTSSTAAVTTPEIQRFEKGGKIGSWSTFGNGSTKN